VCVCVCTRAWVTACACVRVAGAWKSAGVFAHVALLIEPLWLHHIFRHFLINGTIFGKKKLPNIKLCVLSFCTTFIWNINNSKKNSERHYHERKNVFISSNCYSCRILIKLEILSTDFRKRFKYEKASKSVQCEPNSSMRTDRHDEANSSFSQFCERA
jgi:hypothetical protein